MGLGGKGLVLPAAAGVGDDGSMQCSEHPQYGQANPAGGVCPLCLQEKLRRLLVPSSSSTSSSSTKPSSSLDYSAVAAPLYSDDYSLPSSSGSIRPTVLEASVSSVYGSGVKVAANNKDSAANNHRRGSSSSRSRMIPFFYATHHKKKKGGDGGSSASGVPGNLVLKRSKSVRAIGGSSMSAGKTEIISLDSPRKKSFWSLFHLSSSHVRDHHASGGGGGGAERATSYIRDIKLLPYPPQLPAVSTGAEQDNGAKQRECPLGGSLVEEAPSNSPGSRGSQASASFSRKVSRSRSVGCGSRSLSGDFLERISTVGLGGDCTLRRVESQREGQPKMAKAQQRVPGTGEDQELHQPPHKIRCGLIFAGFTSSAYWPSDNQGSGRTPAVVPAGGENGTPRTRRSWASAFASPMMRALSRPSGKHAATAFNDGATDSPLGTASPTTAVGGDTDFLSAANVTGGALLAGGG